MEKGDGKRKYFETFIPCAAACFLELIALVSLVLLRDKKFLKFNFFDAIFLSMTKLLFFFCNNYGTFIYCFATYFQEVSAGVLLKVATKC